ncbi:MAG: ATP-binding protein [Pseudoalteromonas sp.]|uniref:AAA family ATPase n=1 Tax=Pseudoalteromonas sp. TaxID=53249 RepID=UPI001DF3154F|nr:AAA family ATPase [Pseudoalteromonas sp.]NRA77177.1 ATP-binding protein [Pseudoalteromonas sp.]
MKLNISAVSLFVKRVMTAGLVPFVAGSPGLGKSAVAKDIANEWDLKLIDVRLSQCDPTDLNGFISTNAEKTKCGYLPIDTFPIEGDKLPVDEEVSIIDDKGNKVIIKPRREYKGWLLLLDEINSAPRLVQAAAYKLVLDKQVGKFDIHHKVVMMTAGNLKSDGAIVNDMGTAMASRLVHCEMGADVESFTTWATKVGIDHRVIAYVNFRPENLHNFDPKHSDKTFPCPRTWEFTSKLIKGEVNLKGFMAVVEGAIGAGASREFMTFCEIYGELPTIQEMVKDPDSVVISNEPSVKYAIAGMISEFADTKNIGQLMKVVNKLPFEFQMIALQGTVQRDRTLLQNPDVMAWVTTQSKHMVAGA